MTKTTNTDQPINKQDITDIEFVRVGDIAASIAKQYIMRAYQDGAFTEQESMDLIAFMALKHS